MSLSIDKFENESASLRLSIAHLNKNLRELIDLLKDNKLRKREGSIF